MARNYDPNDYTVYFAGTLIDRGLVSIVVSREAEAFTQQVGIDGDTTRSRNNNKNFTCELTLMQTSPINQSLSDLYNSDLTGNGAGAGTFSLVDNNGDTEVSANKAWITNVPDITVGAEAGERTWTLYLERPDWGAAGVPEF